MQENNSDFIQKKTIIHNVKGSNFGNLMIKYIVAKKIIERLDNILLSNYDMPYWNISCPVVNERGSDPLNAWHDQRIDINRMRYFIKSRLISSLELHGHLQRMENFPDKSIAKGYFASPSSSGTRFGERFLVCPIRGAEILDAIHPGYSLLPIGFYADIIDKTGLTPVFCGQTQENIYIQGLRRKFPNAIFLPTQGAINDFDIIRMSYNIVLPISTFAWLAAWLSDAASIFLPVYGLFNPMQFVDHDLLPIGDPRYLFYQFPIQEAVPLDEYEKAHMSIAGSWYAVSAGQLAKGMIS